MSTSKAFSALNRRGVVSLDLSLFNAKEKESQNPRKPMKPTSRESLFEKVEDTSEELVLVQINNRFSIIGADVSPDEKPMPSQIKNVIAFAIDEGVGTQDCISCGVTYPKTVDFFHGNGKRRPLRSSCKWCFNSKNRRSQPDNAETAKPVVVSFDAEEERQKKLAGLVIDDMDSIIGGADASPTPVPAPVPKVSKSQNFDTLFKEWVVAENNFHSCSKKISSRGASRLISKNDHGWTVATLLADLKIENSFSSLQRKSLGTRFSSGLSLLTGKRKIGSRNNRNVYPSHECFRKWAEGVAKSLANPS